MKKRMFQGAAVILVIALIAANAHAGFIVEPHSSGLGNANFTCAGTPSLASKAVGLTATNSIYSGTGSPDSSQTFVYSYTPGVDADNAVIAAGTDLGNGQLATGLAGGGSGLYNVYITWPPTANVNAAGCEIIIQNDGDDVVHAALDMNTGGTGSPGGNDAWLLIAENVKLTAGTTYTVTQTANAWTWTSMRSAGVMWEFREIPEPATLMLLGLGGLLFRRRR